MYMNASTHKWLTDEQRATRAKQDSGCPLCGGPVKYRGLFGLDCGGKPDCPNFAGAVYGAQQFGYMQAIAYLEQGLRVRFSVRPSERDPSWGDPITEYWHTLEPSELANVRGMNAENIDKIHVFELAP